MPTTLALTTSPGLKQSQIFNLSAPASREQEASADGKMLCNIEHTCSSDIVQSNDTLPVLLAWLSLYAYDI